ncbi:lycopene cyclase [Pseudomonas syringae]|uniref:Lycopene beta-cyclase n=1 Tax=Pseudomonas syringae TaxID=317 RepID=A0AB37ZW43_PSESX|nr:lycopene beta-cyclase CrtY [Pseudomonas syringae]MBI6669651.1 lycopene beta-cyclase CrtY [Pseudomonas syringae]MBI6679662.1 lycopene beta-cyclase CrtY [Pseudomonas syringae]MBI6839636.1 lycopene beta-cyclase CrtY [Pseudomonas syringae]NAP22213.1 lycopene beta-cyclase CrtY [Pseudomonas syringae]NAQ17822.1 lycopene beta-cyclase CrtY [Pseudomonas syringae]
MKYDLILAGAGLANGLIAWRLKQLRPELRVLCIEQQTSIGGNHTWSFHSGDLSEVQHQWIDPLVVRRWPCYDVHFPGRSRRLSSGYASIDSERFVQVIGAALGDDLRTGQAIVQTGPRSVTLNSGEELVAQAVIDGRGVGDSEHLVLGRQAFVGQLLQLQAPHGLEAPIIMDARVIQGEGYRFVYVLPFTADTVLVEDTHYVDQHALSSEQLRTHIAEYVREQGWTIAACLREEQGILPITLAGDFARFWGDADGQPRSGLRAGLFHCTTGYSLPHAVRLADWIAQQPALDADSLASGMRAFAGQAWRRQRFYRLLNRMLFLAGRPQDRWQVMQRFYGLSEGLISRFYAGENSLADKLRVVSGKPPVPIRQALHAALRYLPRHYENRK